YDSLLWVRYQYVDGMWDELKRIQERAEKSKAHRKELYGQAQVLVFACKEILVKDPNRKDSDERGFAPIDQGSEDPIRFDKRLGAIFEFDVQKASDAVFGIFRNDLAVTAQHNDLMEWAQSNQVDLDKELQGE